MSCKVIVLAIPGIGTQPIGFSNKLMDDVDKLSKGTVLENSYCVEEALPFKKTNVDANQSELLKRLGRNNQLGGMLSLRKLVVNAFGDGVTFESGANRSDSVYRKVHEYLRRRIIEVNIKMSENEGAKLVVVAASMGVHLLSTYIWDADNSKGIFESNGATDNDNLRNLDYLFSLGCNIPLFISGKSVQDIVPIDKRNANFKWDNYYDRDDVLGWPLADINEAYGALVKDYEINAGSYIGSHVRYWNDNDFTKPFVNSLINLLD